MDDPIAHATQRLRSALTKGCRMSWSREIVRLKFERGDYAGIIQAHAMDEGTREALARELVREICGEVEGG